jgi:3-hydroxypropanoate dehydrogenase
VFNYIGDEMTTLTTASQSTEMLAPEPTPAAARTPYLAIDDQAADRLFREARTANAFTDEPVTEEHVRQIYELAKFGPTALNAQPLRITLIRSAEARARLVKLMAPGNQAKTAAAPLVAILSYDVDFHDRLPEVFPHAPGVREGFVDQTERRVAFASMNAAMQAGYFIMAVRAAGLAAGPMGGFTADGINTEFFADGSQRVLMVVNIGRPGPDAWGQRLPRLTFAEAVTAL